MNLKYNMIMANMDTTEIELFQLMFQETSLLMDHKSISMEFNKHLELAEHELIIDALNSLKKKIMKLNLLDINLLIIHF